jgi:hypothetical protein
VDGTQYVRSRKAITIRFREGKTTPFQMTRPANIGKFILLVEEETGGKEWWWNERQGCGLRSEGSNTDYRPDMKRFPLQWTADWYEAQKWDLTSETKIDDQLQIKTLFITFLPGRKFSVQKEGDSKCRSVWIRCT